MTKVSTTVPAQFRRTEGAAAPRAAAPAPQVGATTAEIDLEKLMKAKGTIPQGGKAVSSTASAGALWGEQPSASRTDKPPLDTMALRNLSPSQCQAKVTELKKEKAELADKIGHRCGEVDQKWDWSRLHKRSGVLHDYAEKTPQVTPEAKQQIDAALAKSDDAYNQLEAMKVKLKAMGPKGSPTGGTPEERAALVSQIMKLRRQESAGIHEATAVIDGLGLKVDRLAEAEATIDPKGAETSAYGSLKVLVTHYYQVCFNLNVCEQFNDPMANALATATRHMVEDDRRKDIIMAAWRQKEEIKKASIEDLKISSADLVSATGLLGSSNPDQKAEGEKLLARGAARRQ